METCAIPSESLSSWEDYKSLISTTLHPVRDRFLFRGQSDKTWTLRTTFEKTFAETPEDKREEISAKASYLAALIEAFSGQTKCANTEPCSFSRPAGSQAGQSGR